MKHTSCLWAFACVLCAQAEMLEWNADSQEPAPGGGKLLVVRDEAQGITAVTKNSDGDLTLTGDPLTLARDASLLLDRGFWTFDVPVAAAGTLTLDYANAGSYVYDGKPLSKEEETLVFENADLDEIVPLYCDYNKNNYPGCVFALKGTGRAYNVVRGEGTLSVQFQRLDRPFTKSVKVVFAQRGQSVYAKIDHALYIEDIFVLGADFDTLPGTIPYRIAIDNPGIHGYDVDYIVMGLRADNNHAFVFNQSISGVDKISGANVNVVFSGDDSLSASGAYGGSFHTDAAITFMGRAQGAYDLSGRFTGCGNVAFRAREGDVPVREGASVTVRGPLTQKIQTETQEKEYVYFGKEWHPVAEGNLLDHVTDFTGVIYGKSIARDETPHVYFVSNSVDGLVRCYQFQTHDGYFKTIDVELGQIGDKLCVRVPRAQYCDWSRVPGMEDEKFGYILTEEDAKTKGGNGYSTASYNFESLTVSYKTHTYRRLARAVMSGENAMTNGILEVSGTESERMCLSLTSASALPPWGGLTVQSGGIVELDADGLNLWDGYSACNSLIHVGPGGELRQMKLNAFGRNGQRVQVTGGALHFGYGYGPIVYKSDKDSGTYMIYLDLADGACVSGRYPRVSYTHTSMWTSSGSGPNTVECGITLVGGENSMPSYFNIDCTADLHIKGEIIDYPYLGAGGDVTMTNCIIQKTGPAKLVQLGPNFNVAPVRLYGGTWELGASGLVDEKKVFELHGGTLALAAGAVQTLDVLPLLTNGVCGVSLGEAAHLHVGSVSFAEGAVLDISGPECVEGRRTGLRIGTAASLSAEELAKMRYNGAFVVQDGEGWIRRRVGGTVVLFR